MVALYKDPHGDNVFVAHGEADMTRSTRTLETTLHFERQNGRENSQDTDALRQRIQYLEKQLAEHNTYTCTVCLQVGFDATCINVIIALFL